MGDSVDRLILWDIDGTLLTTDGIAAATMQAAMREVLGPLPPLARSAYAGKTDWQIIRENFPHLAVETIGEQLNAFGTAYTALLEPQRAELIARSRIMPGVREALTALAPLAYQAPLTGNMAAIARIKLDVVGLLAYLDMGAGAFGDDHHDRERLVDVAIERAEQRYGRRFAGAEIVVIGDTPNDIRCGRANGTRTVAVATGVYSLDDLREHDPDALLADLSDTAAAVQAILGSRH
jgi:phosphoglycolate phosphatase-like HAD superfamily hydrolase